MTVIELIAAILIIIGFITGITIGWSRGHSVWSALLGAFAGGVSALIGFMLCMITISFCIFLVVKISGKNPFDEEGDPSLERNRIDTHD